MLYLDTSLVVAAVANERTSHSVQAWLAAQQPTELCISDWTITEVSSALSVKLRAGRIDSQGRAAALALFNKMLAETLNLLPVTGGHFRQAAALSDQHGLGLRAGDALHAAIAQEHGAAIQTLDRGLADAALALGIGAHLHL